MFRRTELGISDVEELRSELTRLREDLACTLEALITAARSEAGEVRDKLVDNAEQWLHEVRGSLGTAGQRSRNALRSVQHQIEDAPLVSVAIAFAAGLIIGRLAGRNH